MFVARSVLHGATVPCPHSKCRGRGRGSRPGRQGPGRFTVVWGDTMLTCPIHMLRGRFESLNGITCNRGMLTPPKPGLRGTKLHSGILRDFVLSRAQHLSLPPIHTLSAAHLPPKRGSSLPTCHLRTPHSSSSRTRHITPGREPVEGLNRIKGGMPLKPPGPRPVPPPLAHPLPPPLRWASVPSRATPRPSTARCRTRATARPPIRLRSLHSQRPGICPIRAGMEV